MKKICAAVLFCFAGNAPAFALTVDCGRLLDVKSGQWREHAAIVVQDGKVASLEKSAPTPAADHIDLRGYDSHHLRRRIFNCRQSERLVSIRWPSSSRANSRSANAAVAASSA